jgi:hypothetical protein
MLVLLLHRRRREEGVWFYPKICQIGKWELHVGIKKKTENLALLALGSFYYIRELGVTCPFVLTFQK